VHAIIQEEQKSALRASRYERFYEAACHCLGRREYRLKPAIYVSGVRYRRIGGIDRTDEEIFKDAWGVEIANQVDGILRKTG
jgi:hypothetical protein